MLIRKVGRIGRPVAGIVLSSLIALATTVAIHASPPNASAVNGKGRLTLDLLLDWETVATPQISPDGSQVVYARRWTDKLNDKFETDLWIVNVDGSKNRFLVKGGSPRWSPDGKRLLYLAPGQPSGTQIWVRWMDSGEDTQLTRLERAATGVDWSPDGKKIAFSMNVPSRPAFTVRLPQRPNGAKWVDEIGRAHV